MLYFLAEYYKQSFPFLAVVHYVSFRALIGMMSTLFFSIVFGSWFIEKGSSLLRARSRQYTPKHTRVTNDPPTMGGLFIVASVVVSTLLWSNLKDPLVWIILFGLIGFSAIGALDDWYKIKWNKGISSKTKFVLQLLVALLLCLLWYQTPFFSPSITVPFFKSVHPELGYLFLLWFMLVVVGTSNAVNLTDGLDGLAITSLIPNFLVFSLICYVAGNVVIASYLLIPFSYTAEVAIIGMMLAGASLGFLWYNAYPAQIVMGDAGSLALGAVLGLMALLSKQELLLVISGGLFVVETISVMLQMLSYRFRGKRLFRMAPIHHHFELLGWPESKITVRFGIISIMLCVIAVMTLKLR